MEGAYYDDFRGPEQLNEAQRLGLANERAGTEARVRDFYLPAVLGLPRPVDRALRLLDSGCGNGISVDRFAEQGIEAWGNEVSALRMWQWRERVSCDRLVAADSRRLPFPDGYFDVVISSGVLEHVGVAERGGDAYHVEPLPERDAMRVAFLGELLRVTAAGGVLFLDFPNGAFPIDFWHGTVPGHARFHSLREGFLPTVGDVRGYVGALGPYRVRPLSPRGRLRMRQVGRHWYGRALQWPMRALLAAMGLPGLRWLAGSPVNPYLVLRVESR